MPKFFLVAVLLLAACDEQVSRQDMQGDMRRVVSEELAPARADIRDLQTRVGRLEASQPEEETGTGERQRAPSAVIASGHYEADGTCRGICRA